MDKLSKQDVFNLTWQYYVVEDGKRGINCEEECVYFAEEGGMCAVGNLLNHLGFTVEDLNKGRGERYDGTPVTESLNMGINASEVVSFLGSRFKDRVDSAVWADDDSGVDYKAPRYWLGRLQNAHDKLKPTGTMAEVLTDFAEAEGQTIPTK